MKLCANHNMCSWDKVCSESYVYVVCSWLYSPDEYILFCTKHADEYINANSYLPLNLHKVSEKEYLMRKALQ